MAQGRISDLLNHPLTIAAIGAIFAGYSGFAIGQATTTERINKIEADFARMDRRDDVQDARLNGLSGDAWCVTRQLDKLNTKLAIDPPCTIGE